MTTGTKKRETTPDHRSLRTHDQHAATFKIRGGDTEVSKRERFKWTTKDSPGEFAMIDKTKLRTGAEYQRLANTKRVLKLAAEWSWIACGTIAVALREDAEWWVLDGQHRVLAAMNRDDIKELPCMVFDLDTVKEEAEGFLNSNLNRKNPTMVDRFPALVSTESRGARVIEELVLKVGRHVGPGGSHLAVGCVSSLMSAIEEDEMRLRRVWSVIDEVCRGRKILQDLVGGFFYLEGHLDDDESLASRRWQSRAVSVGYDEIMRSIDETAAYYRSRGAKNCALGIVKALNYGMRKPLKHTIVKED